MKVFVVATALVAGLIMGNCLPAFSQERVALILTPNQSRAYHACLFAAWVEEFCRANSWRWSPSYDRVFPACVIANGGGRYPLDGRQSWYNTDDYCWSSARGLLR